MRGRGQSPDPQREALVKAGDRGVLERGEGGGFKGLCTKHGPKMAFLLRTIYFSPEEFFVGPGGGLRGGGGGAPPYIFRPLKHAWRGGAAHNGAQYRRPAASRSLTRRDPRTHCGPEHPSVSPK